MKEEFLRLKATDGVELCGVLYKPLNDSKKCVLHVHGLSGNFYENRFVSYLAKLYTKMGYAFLTFNNRGNGYFSDLLKEDKGITFIMGGGAYEDFRECVYDIKGVINYLKEIGMTEIILQGHSYGCNKVVYYYNLERDKSITKIILLAPCDIVEEIKVFMGDKYEDVKSAAHYFLENNNGNELIDTPLFPLTFSAKTLLNDFMSNSISDIFRYRLEYYEHEMLKDIDIPVLIEIGTKDDCVLVVDKDKVDNYFKNNLSNYKLDYINGSVHNYLDKEKILVNNINDWLSN